MQKNEIRRIVDEKCQGCLTKMEREVLKYVIMGKSNNEIARELQISLDAEKALESSILGKMSVDNRVQVAIKAVKESLI